MEDRQDDLQSLISAPAARVLEIARTEGSVAAAKFAIAKKLWRTAAMYYDRALTERAVRRALWH